MFTGHKATGVTEEEHSSSAIFLRFAESVQHIVLGPVLQALGICLEQSGSHGRDDVAWRDGVDADAILTPFRCKVAGQLDDRGL